MEENRKKELLKLLKKRALIHFPEHMTKEEFEILLNEKLITIRNMPTLDDDFSSYAIVELTVHGLKSLYGY